MQAEGNHASCSMMDDGRALMSLARCPELSDDLAECVISRFAEANFARINNKAGFLMGIIRRVREDGPDGGGADLKILPRSVEHAIRGLMDEVRSELCESGTENTVSGPASSATLQGKVACK